MQIATLAVAEHPREFEDLLLARGQQLLGGEFRRGPQITRRARAVGVGSSSVRGACRCVSLPGDTCRIPVSTSTKPCSSNQARSARVIAPRACRNGFRSACRDADHHGEGWSILLISDRSRRAAQSRTARRASTSFRKSADRIDIIRLSLQPSQPAHEPIMACFAARLFMSKDARLVHARLPLVAP